MLRITYNFILSYSNRHFREIFHVSKREFLVVSERLEPYLSPPYRKRGKPCVPLNITIAAGLYMLRTGASLRAAGEWFGFSYVAIRNAFIKFLDAFVQAFSGEIKMPTEEEIDEQQDILLAKALSKGALWFPRTSGAIDGSHIILRKPSENVRAWLNRHGNQASTNVLAYVDIKAKFRYVAVGAPGSVHDSRVLTASKLQEILPGTSLVLGKCSS